MYEYWMLDAGYSMLDTGYWMLDAIYWKLDTQYSMTMVQFCPTVIEHRESSVKGKLPMKLRLPGTVKRLNVEHRTSNIEHRILMVL